MKNLGIILGFTPRELVPHEGIARLIGFVVRGAVNSPEVSVTIAGPAWLRKEIKYLLEDAGIDPQKVDIVTTSGEPFLIRFWRLSQRFKRKARPTVRKNRLMALLTQVLSYIVAWLSSASIFMFLAGGIVFALLAIVFAIPVLIGGTAVAAFLIYRRLSPRIKSSKLYKVRKWLSAKIGYVVSTVGPLDKVRSTELDRLVKKLNKRRDIDVWYVPSMFWPEVSNLQGKVLMAAPDIVFYEHPAQFLSPGDERMLGRMTKSIAAADHLICYSDYVKQNHIVKHHSVPSDRVHVIRHGYVDTASIEKGDGSRESSLEVLHTYIDEKKNHLPEYLRGFRFDDVDFLFYSSQVRPHKNIESLIVVFERLLREHYRPVKLVLTGRVLGNPRLKHIIDKYGLGRDVISLPSIPNHVLAALYRLATVSVTPTQFEGGFPFTFSEAYSVGTPSVMSRIPVVEELIDDENLLERMTFNPHNQREMLDRILWALDNREELIALQKPLFDKFSARSWDIVANEYVDLAVNIASAQMNGIEDRSR